VKGPPSGALIGEVEEEFVAQNRSTYAAAVFIPPQRRTFAGGREVILRIESVVLNKFKGGTVPLVGASESH
jgi:hypothetical protein